MALRKRVCPPMFRYRQRGNRMVEILIQNGDAATAANELARAVHEIFDIEPRRAGTTGQPRPGTRMLAEAALITLALPPAVLGTVDILKRVQLGDRLKRLGGKAEQVRKATGASIMIDPGDGKHIPLEQASHDLIVDALHALEKHLKR